MNVRNSENIQDKWLLFQRFVMISIVDPRIQDLLNSPDDKKDKFNNWFIIHSNIT